jgi:hypothetical protein
MGSRGCGDGDRPHPVARAWETLFLFWTDAAEVHHRSQYINPTKNTLARRPSCVLLRITPGGECAYGLE